MSWSGPVLFRPYFYFTCVFFKPFCFQPVCLGVVFCHQVWQWNTFTALTEHAMMELQLRAGSAAAATAAFATSVFNAEWSAVNLKGPGAGLVQCHIKLRGVEFINRPSAPPAEDQEAPVSAMMPATCTLPVSLITVSSMLTSLKAFVSATTACSSC